MLAIDVGNTNITTGIFKGSELKAVYRTPTEKCLTDNAFFHHVPEARDALPEQAVMVSVRRQVTDLISREILSSTGTPPIL
ncbi:MAG TPA: type III pantothenate kinase, partial [Desulfomonilia bacterium]|nr:type III pantothenate kinase [Desulfomonilia bacterium]